MVDIYWNLQEKIWKREPEQSRTEIVKVEALFI